MANEDFVLPSNAEELANIAEEVGAEVLRGALRYPSDSGGWKLDKLDLSEHLAKYWDQDIVVIVASLGEAGEVEPEKYVCGICGFEMNELGDCPRCKMQIDRTSAGLRRRQAQQEMFDEIGEALRDAGQDWKDDEAGGDADDGLEYDWNDEESE